MKARILSLLLSAVMLTGTLPGLCTVTRAEDTVEATTVFDYNCDSLTDPVVSAKSNKAPAYYFADSNTPGVEPGTILAGSDGSAEGYSTLNFTFDLPQPSFSLELDMKIDSLMTPSGSSAWRGLTFELNVPGSRIVYISVNSLSETDSDGTNADIYTFKALRSSSSTMRDRIAVPTDGAFHKWEIKFDGENEIRVFIDGELQADFRGITLSSEATTGTLRISNAMNSRFSGTNQVVFDNIKLISGVSMNRLTAAVDPASTQKSFTLHTELQKLTDNTEVTFTVTSKDDPAKAYTHSYKPQSLASSVTVTDIPFTGLCEITVSATDAVDETLDYYVYADMETVLPGGTVTAGTPLTAYKFTSLHVSGFPEKTNWSTKYFTYADGTFGSAVYCAGLDVQESFTVPVTLNGKFAVYVGYLPGTYSFTVNDRNVVVTYNKTSGNIINERFAVAGDFKNEKITIANTLGYASTLAYVKLVSISDETYARYTVENDERHMMLDNDGFSLYTGGAERGTAEYLIDSYVTRYAEAINLSQYNFAAWVTGALNYKSEVQRAYIEKRFTELGVPREKWPKDFVDFVDINGNPMDFSDTMRESDKRFIQNIRALNEIGTPQEILAKHVTDNDLGEVYASLRMSAYYDSDSEVAGGYANGTFYFIHPEWKIEGRNQLSYYYEEYRDYIYGVLMEMASFENIAGITMDFARYPYIFGNECPDVAERTRIMNEFVKRVHDNLPAGKKLNVRLSNPTAVKAEPYGLDYKAWVKEGLVDRVIISEQGHESFFNVTEYAEFFKDYPDVEWYVGIIATLSGHDKTKEEEATGVKTEETAYVTLEQHLLRAHEAYAAGADGIFLFNTVNVLFRELGGPTPAYAYMNNKDLIEKWYIFEYPAYTLSETVLFVNARKVPEEFKTTGINAQTPADPAETTADTAADTTADTTGTDEPAAEKPAVSLTYIYMAAGGAVVIAGAAAAALLTKKKK